MLSQEAVYKINKRPKDDMSDEDKDNKPKNAPYLIRTYSISLSDRVKQSITTFINDIGVQLSSEANPQNTSNIHQLIDEFKQDLDVMIEPLLCDVSKWKQILNDYYKMKFTNYSSFSALNDIVSSYDQYNNDDDDDESIQCNLIGAVLLIIYRYKTNKDLIMKCLEILDYILECGVLPTINPFPSNSSYNSHNDIENTLKLTSIYDEWKNSNNILNNNGPYMEMIKNGEKCCGFRTIYHLSVSMQSIFTDKEIAQKVLHIMNYSMTLNGYLLKPAIITLWKPQNVDEGCHSFIYYGGFGKYENDEVPPFESLRQFIWSDTEILQCFEYYDQHFNEMEKEFASNMNQKWRKTFLLSNWSKIPKQLIANNTNTMKEVCYKYCPLLILIREMIKEIKSELLNILNVSLQNTPQSIVNEIYSHLFNVEDYSYLYPPNFDDKILIQNCLQHMFCGDIEWIEYFVDKIYLSSEYESIFKENDIIFEDKTGDNAAAKFIDCIVSKTLPPKIMDHLFPLFRGDLNKQQTLLMIKHLLDNEKLLKTVFKCKYYKDVWFEKDTNKSDQFLCELMRNRKEDDKILNIMINMVPIDDKYKKKYRKLFVNIIQKYRIKNDEINLFKNTIKLLKILKNKNIIEIERFFGILFFEGNVEFFDFMMKNDCFNLQNTLKGKHLDIVFQAFIPMVLIDWNDKTHPILLNKILNWINQKCISIKRRNNLIKSFYRKWIVQTSGSINCDQWYQLLYKYQSDMMQILYPSELIIDDEKEQNEEEIKKELFRTNGVSIAALINNKWQSKGSDGKLKLLMINKKGIELEFIHKGYGSSSFFIPVRAICTNSSCYDETKLIINCYAKNHTPYSIRHCLKFKNKEIKNQFKQYFIKNYQKMSRVQIYKIGK